MNNIEKAYLAGVVDGEGTVSLMKHHPNEMPSPVVAIASNSLGLLEWVKRRVGGTIVFKKETPVTSPVLLCLVHKV